MSMILTARSIGELSSIQSLVAFFSRIGYKTDASTVDDAAIFRSLHNNTNLRDKVTGFRRISQYTDLTNYTLCVYLYVVRSLTKSLVREVVRELKDRRNGEFLLLFAIDPHSSWDNFNRDHSQIDEIEFDFVDRVVFQPKPHVQQLTLIQDEYAHVPAKDEKYELRTLPIDRRHPDFRAKRLLENLKWSHALVWDQCDVISRAFELAITSDEFFNNRSLFSDHVLSKRLRDDDEWVRTTGTGSEHQDLEDVYEGLRRLYAGSTSKFASMDRDKIQKELFEKVLQHLGFKPQKEKKADKPGERTPDYMLFKQDDPEQTKLAICLTYPWERNLDESPLSEEDELLLDAQDNSSVDDYAHENPAAVAVSLLEQEKVPWAILTNGRFWRLYSAKARSRATSYYEIDLQEALSIHRDQMKDEKALNAVRYFWLFFRAGAFKPRTRTGYDTAPGIAFLDFLMRESEDFARTLGDSLKEQIFDKVFPHFAEGFVKYAQKVGTLLPEPELLRLSAEKRAKLLEPFFEGTLIFLYRLLIFFYAESRTLLPIRDQKYEPRSLKAITKEISDSAGKNKVQRDSSLERFFEQNPGRKNSSVFYDRLQKLFEAIEQGNSGWNIPAYGGDLFITKVDEKIPDEQLSPDEKVARFLQRNKITDQYLMLGLDLMARDEDKPKGANAKQTHELGMIDYKSLGVRQLGSIYEGLLEFKLRIAAEPMVEIKNKIYTVQEAEEKGLYKPGKTRNVTPYKVGDVYIENDRHERKATGTYYTPDYIVQYIIEQTVGPVLQQKFEKLTNRFNAFQRNLLTRQENNKGRASQNQPAQRLSQSYESSTALELVNDLFDIKVLDPAMGSGHFLVDTVDYITDRLTEYLRQFRFNPVQHSLRKRREEILAEVDQQRVRIDRDRLTELDLLKRQVLKRCVFGVDINRMAVTLAKMSLCIHSFASGAPFSFLNNHLKCGNSLLGIDLETLRKNIPDGIFTEYLQQALSGVSLARMLSQGTDSSIQQLKEAQDTYQEMLTKFQPFKILLNLWISEYFGNKEAQATVQTNSREIIKSEYGDFHKRTLTIIEEAERIASPTRKNFFHWDMEFPEAFFHDKRPKEKDEAGFDVVLGNPPYVRQEGLGEDKTAFKEIYKDIFNSIADLYTYFIYRGHKRLLHGGRFGMITANKFMRANYGSALRSFLIEQTKLEKLVDFGDLPVFGDATTYPVIIVSSNDYRNSTPIEYAPIKSLNFEVLTPVADSAGNKMPESAFSGANWSLSDVSEQYILEKLQSISTPLKKCVGDTMRRGIVTGLNDAFFINKNVYQELINEDPKSAEIIKQLVIGEDIKRYDIDYQDRYIIFTRRGIDIKQYKAVEKYLSLYRDRLEPRPLDWDEKRQGRWIGRKPGPYKWYEIQDNIAYFADFSKSRIIYQEIATYQSFAFLSKEMYANGKCFIIPTDNLELLALLNSKLIWFWLSHRVSKLQGGAYAMQAVYLADTPVRRIPFPNASHLREHYRRKAQQLYERSLTANKNTILTEVAHHLSQQPEEATIIHDLLASLAQHMIDLSQQKRKLQDEFLSKLVETLKVQPQPDKDGKTGLDALKTKRLQLINYPGDYQKGEEVLPLKELRYILFDKENKRRFGASPDDKWYEIEQAYEPNREAMHKVKNQLKQTDELIDEIVYRLYGLTEEEIRIVEGK